MILTYLRYYICVRFQWMLVIRGRSSDHGCWWNERRGVANAFIRLAARKKSGNDSFGSSFSAFNQVGDLGSDLRVANGDFSQEKVRERGAVGDEGLKGRFNMGVKKKIGPYFEAGRRSASGRGDLLGPAKSSEQDNSKITGLGAEERVKAHFNPAFEVSEGVEIQISEGVLDPGKYSAVSFKKNIISDQHAKSGNRSAEKPSLALVSGSDVDKSGFINRKGDIKNNKICGSHKNSNALWGHGNRFKSSGSARIPLTESMEVMTTILSTQNPSQNVLDDSRAAGLNIDGDLGLL
ncbi:hypothetical protein GOBAR_DD09841 [Gossypium barbadense]|nr:hypothetical protein GOBAR_DD09841 [Gossypium barbadense]